MCRCGSVLHAASVAPWRDMSRGRAGEACPPHAWGHFGAHWFLRNQRRGRCPPRCGAGASTKPSSRSGTAPAPCSCWASPAAAAEAPLGAGAPSAPPCGCARSGTASAGHTCAMPASQPRGPQIQLRTARPQKRRLCACALRGPAACLPRQRCGQLKQQHVMPPRRASNPLVGACNVGGLPQRQAGWDPDDMHPSWASAGCCGIVLTWQYPLAAWGVAES